MSIGLPGSPGQRAGMSLRHAVPALLALALPVAASAADPPTQDASAVTIYRCSDERGRLVALRDSPCRDGEQQQAVRMQRPQDPAPATITASPAPIADPPPREIRIVTVAPPQPMYECTAADGQTYTSDSGDGNPRWVPLWTVGHPLGVWPRPPPVRPPPMRPPGGVAPPMPGPHPPPPPRVVIPGGAWARDDCVRLPQQDICRRLSDRRFEILRIYHAAMPSGRAELDREQARIDARMANDCPGF